MISRITNTPNYTYLSSGKRIKSASDDAAGLAISEKQKARITELSRRTENLSDEKNMLNVKDGEASNIIDSLQRMRSLAVKANSGIMVSGNREAIQAEIVQIKDELSRYSSNKDNMFLTKNMLGELGLTDFDVTKDFSINNIDNAINKMSEIRSGYGAQTNAIEHEINYNNIESENLTKSESMLSDLDMAKAIFEIKQQKLIRDVRIELQRKETINNIMQTPWGVNIMDGTTFERRI